MDIKGTVALVTGANRGLGRAFTELLIAGGAAKVYGGARDPAATMPPGVEAVELDITSDDDVARAASRCRDVTLLINNAGISTGTHLLADDALAGGRREMDTNVWGTFAMSQALAPVIEANGGGAIVNVLSVLSWLSFPSVAFYSAAKAASWSLTNSLRVELQPRGIAVVGVHAGYLDTDMAAAVEAPKLAPELVVAQTLEALRDGQPEVLADVTSRQVRAALSGDLAALYPSTTRG